MATVSFHLKEPKAEKPTAIFIWFNPQNGQPRIRIYTGDKILPALWAGGDVQRAITKGRTLDPDVKRANEALNVNNDRMSKRLLAFWNDCRAAGTLPTPEALRQVIEPEAAPEAPAALPRPLPDLLAYKERHARTRRPNTVKALGTLHNHLERYEQVTGQPLGYAGFTLQFWHDFTAYLLDTARLVDNSIAKHLAHFKHFLADAQELGRNPLQDYKRWRWTRRDPDVLALTRTELTALETVNVSMLPDARRLENARALFLISAYTGLRFSDVAALKPEHQKGEWLQLTSQKTSGKLTVPLRGNRAVPLLAQLWAGKIHPISNQKLNAYIKDVARLAGIDTPTEQVEYRGSQRTSTTHPKYELISSHTGRRTYVTLSLEGGLSWETIMESTGHKDFKSFRRYIQVTPERLLADFARVWGEQETI
ncbi:tyrosine-type recombinase/integrase [uncultured Hymenobacter sp.]|uniref:site-specific integrase n=1 Tax=uncultured Hymenobacter sp. TaxID=170016 RepID=UPI0035CC8765